MATTRAMRYVPKLINPFKISTRKGAMTHNQITDRVIHTLDQYDYSQERQSQSPKTPIIYFMSYQPTYEHDNAHTITSFMKIYLPDHRTQFWLKRHPEWMIVVDTDKYIHEDQVDNKKAHQIKENLLLTRIWYNENDVRVLMEKGNFAYDYLVAINNKHNIND